MRAMVWLLLAGCGGEVVDSDQDTPALPDAPVDPGVEDPGAEDPGNGDPDPEEPGDPVVTDACLQEPSELWCGLTLEGQPFRLINEGDDIVTESGGQGTGHFYGALTVRNVPQLVRVRYQVVEVDAGYVLADIRWNKALVPLAGGAWDCEGTLSNELIMLNHEGDVGMVFQNYICGLDVDITMSVEEPTSAAEAPVVLGSGTVRARLQPDPLFDVNNGGDIPPLPPCLD